MHRKQLDRGYAGWWRIGIVSPVGKAEKLSAKLASVDATDDIQTSQLMPNKAKRRRPAHKKVYDFMERLEVDIQASYDPIEASIHVGRYALALPFATGRRVLDAACGEGYGSWLLANAGATEVVGVDISSEAIGKARATFQHDALYFDTRSGESLAELLPAGHFDLIVSIETIEHVRDPEAFLHALRQVASPDAIFVITCPNDHWYYRDTGNNPHHLRRLTLEQLKALTIPILGDQVQWLLGTATLGFAAVDIKQELPVDPAQSQFTKVVPSRLTLRVPSGPSGPTPINASYFVGIWNAPNTVDGTGAFQALSMDEYSKMMWTATSPSQLAALQAEVATEHREREIAGVQAAALRRENEVVSSQLLALRESLNAAQNHAAGMTTRVQELDEALAWHVARVRNLDEALDWHVARIQNLRRENEVVSSQLLALRESLNAAQNHAAGMTTRVQELDEALAWHVARVRNLDEALDWHVARIQNLEAEPPSRLLRRALSRTFPASSTLTRLASRLRRRRAGS